MYIEEILLDNFKSFGRRTRIPFYEDFTTVSGPNGSGKSNIIDGVLFALGLARTSGIRAEKLTDLIYNPGHHDEAGNQSGPREASVTVVLNNESETLEANQISSAMGIDHVEDPTEITIRRRVKETDENYYSYYYLNDRSVNLSDIQDLLAQAGITPEGYNVVMQGDVTEIIQMTPYRRREILDEIAGVAEFDEKKDDAIEELDIVKERINEANLRLEEKEDRLEQLEEDRETALEYQALREEKATYEGYQKAAALEEKRATLEDVRADIEELEATIDERRETLAEKESTLESLEADLETLNEEIERKGEDEQLQIKAEMEEIKGEISRLETAIDDAEAAIEDAENDRRDAFVAIDRKEEKLEDIEGDIREVKLEKSSVLSERESLEADLEQVEEEMDSLDSEYDELREELANRKEDLEAAKEEKNELQREQDRLLDEARRRSRDVSEKETDLEGAREERPELTATIEDLESEREKAAENVEEIDQVVTDLEAERDDLREDLDEVEATLQQKQETYAELEANATASGDSSFGRAVTSILNADVDGVHGAVAQLGSVASDYATACETAAGGRLANVVVDDDSVGQRCIERLKQRNAGRATFLPMTKMDDRSRPRLPDHEGVIDFAYNLVDFDDQYSSIFSYVLGSTVVVDSIETAREFMGDYRMVTLDGDLVERSGAMTGGSRSGSRYSFSEEADGKLQRVANDITTLQDSRDELRAEIDDVEDRLEKARNRRSDAKDTLRQIEADLERQRNERETLDNRIERLENELESLEAERSSVQEEMDDIEADIEEKEADIEAIETDIEDLEADIADSKLATLSEKADRLQEDIQEKTNRLNTLDGRLNELKLEKEYTEAEIERARADLEEAQNIKADKQDEIQEHQSTIEEREETLEEKQAEIEALEEELTELKDERTDLKAEISSAKDACDAARSSLREAESKREALRDRAADLEVTIEELAEQTEAYDPDDIPPLSEVKAEISRLETEMEALEPVNMRAIEVYDTVQEQYNQLEERKDVLIDERDEITDRIESYESQKKDAFMEAYEGIDEEFQRIFGRLSDGEGSLHLENEEDPFEAGLTMKAQPGGKPIQRLNAMSGGEKSLTALAFIFAIQRYNPAPFYALDEIDAFLDAANAERVGEMLDELADTAQFVVVTHRSAMLERSERAIGVTMQENNISAVTGIEIGAQEVATDGGT